MGLNTSGMSISTSVWYSRLSHSLVQRSTGSNLHSATRHDLGRRFSDSLCLDEATPPKSPSQTHSRPDVRVASDSAEVSDLQAERLRIAALAEPPEGFPERLHQGELEVDHHVQNGLQGE